MNDLAWWLRKTGFEFGWIGAFGWLATGLTFLAVNGLFTVSPIAWVILKEEDGWVENLTLVFYVLAGALLFVAAKAEKRLFPRFVFIAGCVAMVFMAGEEINWGQRILDPHMPESLQQHTQGEFSFHNRVRTENLPDIGAARVTQGRFSVHNSMNKRWLGVLHKFFLLFMLLLCVTTVAASFSRKAGFFGVPLPTLPLVLALLLICAHSRLSLPLPNPDDAASYIVFHLFRLFNSRDMVVLVVLAAWALFTKRSALVLAAAASIMLFWTDAHVRIQNGHGWIFGETWEMLVSLFWLCYAGELACRGTAARGGAAADVEAPRAGRGEAFPIRPAVSCLVLAGSAGLMAFAHFYVRAVPLMPDVTRSTTPVNAAGFAVHFTGERLVYFRETCELADAHAGDFFVHIVPKDQADLPERRKKSGFDLMYFNFDSQGVLNQGSCYGSVRLPNYAIASIRTGQQDAKGPVWDVELLPPE